MGAATRSRAWRTATDPEAIVRQGGSTVLTIGRNNFSPRETTITRCQIADTRDLDARRPLRCKGGVDFNFDRILNYFPGNFSGSYTFNSLSSFNLGMPSAAGERYVQAFAGAGTTGATTHPDINEYRVLRPGRVAACART